MTKRTAPSLDRHLAFVALEVLRDNDGRMVLAELLDEVGKREVDKIPENMKLKDASGVIRWKKRIQFKSISFLRAGFLRKDKGVWYLTAEGEKALREGEVKVINKAKEAYKEWKEKRDAQKVLPDDTQGDDDTSLPDVKSLDIERYQSTAMAGVQDYIRSLDEYAFQDVCAALLRGMGYHVRDIASPGPDGGIDVLAYTDPLGGRPPRLKVQVKHQSSKVGKPALSQLAGLLTEGDIGVFISSSGFAAGCRDFSRNIGKHLELIDINRFVELWQKHYDKLSEEDKSLLPLQAIYFLDEKRAISK